ncbi:hypothetical protein KI688_003392 [Linnemannia hyalina]|uniref:CsbD-like domain-containing protein n=1 Tax=Linnemannia hyalina TaxID=64524 RepID=A0A9P7XNR2_9FUNG|nr:hypothetical protein KI688_003392 [Linnemannia hyalina]
MTDRLQNTANQVIGGAKQTIGQAIGNPTLAGEGAAQKTRGEITQKAADAKTHTEGIGHSIQGNIQSTFGSAVGNPTLQAKGAANQALGNVERNV